MTFISILLQTCQLIFTGFLLRCILVYSYRLLFHPLHSYPGPFLAKLTDWYGAYHALKRQLHITTYRNHQQWGSVVRNGPSKLVFNSVRAAQEIYHNERLVKSRAYLVTQASPTVYNLFNVVDKSLHRTRRRIVAQGLNDRAVRNFEPVLKQQVSIFIEQLKLASSKNQPIDMSEKCKLLTLDVSGELGFGRSFDLQTDSRNSWMPEALSLSNWRINTYIQFPAIKYSGWETLLLPVLLPRVRRFHRMVSGMIKGRLGQEKHARPDLFSNISEFKDPETGVGLRHMDLWSESTFLIPAGGDTVASLLAGTFFYLSRYPLVYKRLTEEIRSAFTHPDDIRHGSKLSACTYLRACLDETLRISPPSNVTLWRDAPHDAKINPLIIDGHVIPPGTRLGVNIYAIHHNEAYFASPFIYRPERWLPAESGLNEEETKLMHSAFMPFSKGARNCAGIPVAYTEASMVVAETLWQFDFNRSKDDTESAEKDRELIFRMEDIAGSKHSGPLLEFRARDVQV